MVAPNSTASYNANSSHVKFSWPPALNGVERVMLSAQGNLQQMLSAYFSRPINVQLVDAQTFTSLAPGLPASPASPDDYPSIIKSASQENPITQVRRVNLICADKVVCSASSTVHMRSARCANLVLAEKYAIGQTFSKLGQPPLFELLAVGFGDPANDAANVSASAAASAAGSGPLSPSPPPGLEVGAGKSSPLWRRYRISVPEYECEILEVFASRQMFSLQHGGIEWLTGDGATRDGSGVVAREVLLVEGHPAPVNMTMAPVVLVAWAVVILAIVAVIVPLTKVYSGC